MIQICDDMMSMSLSLSLTSVCGRGQLECTEADIVESLDVIVRVIRANHFCHLIVNAESLVSVLHQLMHRKCRIVWLDDCV